MPDSVLEAIKMGIWDFEPKRAGEEDFDATRAMPGTNEKLDIMAERVRNGQPLWHDADKRDFDSETAGEGLFERRL